MTFDASHALRFINEARAAKGLPPLAELPFAGAVRLDERACLLARALQAEVGGSSDPRFGDHFVVRLGDRALARAVASRTGQPCNDHAEVLLPEALARLAVAFDRGHLKRRGARYVPLGQLSFDDLETNGLPRSHDLRRPLGAGPAVSGPGRNGRRPGRPVPATAPSVRTRCRSTRVTVVPRRKVRHRQR